MNKYANESNKKENIIKGKMSADLLQNFFKLDIVELGEISIKANCKSLQP